MRAQRALSDVDLIIRERRLQEAFCLRWADCERPTTDPRLESLAFSASFETCLRDEELQGDKDGD